MTRSAQGVLLGTILAATISAAHAQTIPSDPKPNCTFASAEFAGWFPGGHAMNTAATQVELPSEPTNCDILKWAARGFLSLTAPGVPITTSGAMRNAGAKEARDSDLLVTRKGAAVYFETFRDAPPPLKIETYWIEIPEQDAAKYVTRQATIRPYDTTKPTWTQTGKSRNATLGLVRLRMSASTEHGNVSATFDRFGLMPNTGYTYVNTGGQTVSVPLNTSGDWLFCDVNCAPPFNKPTARVQGVSIVSTSKAPITPGNWIRKEPWGTSGDNTTVISANNAWLMQMPNGDPRKNYLLVDASLKSKTSVATVPQAAPTAVRQDSAAITAPVKFEGAASVFERRGDEWVEIQKGAVAWHFREVRNDGTYLYLKDEGRGMMLKLPLAGGMSYWTDANNPDWNALMTVVPS